MAVIKEKISQKKMELTVDLKELFGTEVSSPSVRQAIGQAMIDTIVERTRQGQKLGGGSFKGYSTKYKESLAYQVAGKTGDVNLTLTGDMLGSLNITEDRSTSIKIGVVGQTQNAKSFNHHTGDTVPARPFFGLQQNELKDIVDGFKREVQVRESLVSAGRQGESAFRRETVNQIRQVLQNLEEEE
jgi:hypothetical protein